MKKNNVIWFIRNYSLYLLILHFELLYNRFWPIKGQTHDPPPPFLLSQGILLRHVCALLY